ncbi:ribbon-helix-helix domain-containing protein [Teichococcus vastitatis]|uniref:ribbon-helix-helix domain-containing protein n=1 Tax=Teichococcus vastitatis TaxID=2307076 RepID=UPI000E74B4E8|nr:CopG family transcriptional regulator [Pseudoroseomonas vastitatis]
MAIARKPGSSTPPPDEVAAEKFIQAAGKVPEKVEPADESGMKPTMIRMEEALRKRIDAAAKADGMGRSAWIRNACIQKLEGQGR